MRPALLLSIGLTIVTCGAGTANAFHGCMRSGAYTGFQSYGFLGGTYPTNIRYGGSNGEGFMLPCVGCNGDFGGGCNGGGYYGGGYYGGGNGGCGSSHGGGHRSCLNLFGAMCGCARHVGCGIHKLKHGKGRGGFSSGCGMGCGGGGCGDSCGGFSGCGGGSCGSGSCGGGSCGNGSCGGGGCADGSCGGTSTTIDGGYSAPIQEMQSPPIPDAQTSVGRAKVRLVGNLRRDGSASYDRGISKFRSGSMTDALGEFENAAGAEPDNAMYQYYRALALYNLHGADAAQEALQLAVETDRSQPVANWGKQMERVQGRARVWVEKARREAGLVK